jgi:hypothetical protein
VQLIDAQTDRHVWPQNYDRTLADSIALPGRVGHEVAAALGADAESTRKSARGSEADDQSGAYDAYLRGRAFAGGAPLISLPWTVRSVYIKRQ